MESEHSTKFWKAIKLGWISRHLSQRWELSLYVFCNGFASMAILALAAWMTRSPLVFPSLGPTAYLLFLFPLAASASPRSCLLGHAIGIACGFVALLVTGLWGLPDSLAHPVTLPRVLAAALSLSLTAGIMTLTRIDHAPACATTLIISLGVISGPADLGLIEFAVFLLVLQAFILNRFAGIRYPTWQADRCD